MTLSTPIPGTDPALPDAIPEHPRLEDFDPRARAMLAKLGRKGSRNLAWEAGIEHGHDAEAAYPRDPALAVEEAMEAQRRRPLVEEVEALVEIEDTLRILSLIMVRESELDARDCEALAWLVTRAERLAQHERQISSELARRLWCATETGRNWEKRFPKRDEHSARKADTSGDRTDA